MKVLKNYAQMIILFIAMILGGIIGIYFKDIANAIKPLGDLFINLIFTITIPLIFFTIASAIANMNQPKRFGKVILSMVIVFIITSIIAIFVGIIGVFIAPPLNAKDIEVVQNDTVTVDTKTNQEDNMLNLVVNAVTVTDFNELLTTKNMIALIIASIIFGIATNMTKEKGKPVKDLLNAGNEVMMKVVSIIMYYAPIGLGCYFASIIADIGETIVAGYVRCFVSYTITAILYYFIAYTVYAFIANGKQGIKSFWKHIIPPTVTAISTCSSAATIPFSIKATKNMGVSDDIAETVIPLGVNIHKDGTLISTVFKIAFVATIYGANIGILPIIGVSLIAGVLMGAVPGTGLVSEMMILTMFGFPMEAIGIVSIIGTIIDCPGTVLNGVGNVSSAMLVGRMVDGKYNENEASTA